MTDDFFGYPVVSKIVLDYSEFTINGGIYYHNVYSKNLVEGFSPGSKDDPLRIYMRMDPEIINYISNIAHKYDLFFSSNNDKVNGFFVELHRSLNDFHDEYIELNSASYLSQQNSLLLEESSSQVQNVNTTKNKFISKEIAPNSWPYKMAFSIKKKGKLQLILPGKINRAHEQAKFSYKNKISKICYLSNNIWKKIKTNSNDNKLPRRFIDIKNKPKSIFKVKKRLNSTDILRLQALQLTEDPPLHKIKRNTIKFKSPSSTKIKKSPFPMRRLFQDMITTRKHTGNPLTPTTPPLSTHPSTRASSSPRTKKISATTTSKSIESFNDTIEDRQPVPVGVTGSESIYLKPKLWENIVDCTSNSYDGSYSSLTDCEDLSPNSLDDFINIFTKPSSPIKSDLRKHILRPTTLRGQIQPTKPLIKSTNKSKPESRKTSSQINSRPKVDDLMENEDITPLDALSTFLNNVNEIEVIYNTNNTNIINSSEITQTSLTSLKSCHHDHSLPITSEANKLQRDTLKIDSPLLYKPESAKTAYSSDSFDYEDDFHHDEENIKWNSKFEIKAWNNNDDEDNYNDNILDEKAVSEITNEYDFSVRDKDDLSYYTLNEWFDNSELKTVTPAANDYDDENENENGIPYEEEEVQYPTDSYDKTSLNHFNSIYNKNSVSIHNKQKAKHNTKRVSLLPPIAPHAPVSVPVPATNTKIVFKRSVRIFKS